MKTLSKQQIILLHEHMIQETGGAHGLRDEGMLDSALAAPFQEVFGAVAYPSIQQKAARLGYTQSLIARLTSTQSGRTSPTPFSIISLCPSAL